MTDTFADQILFWFDRHGRKDLPWQQQVTPYRVWVSEIMLQQTQVTTVIPFYQRFMSAFPTVDALANANEDVVLHHWTGLGYYARARNLHKTARLLIRDFNGELPLDVAALCALPGIGRSTAGAIVAICSNRKAVILDGNVKRVLARAFAIDGWPGQKSTANALWDKATALTPEARVADYTQAMMDLGAIVCTRTNPDCTNCPLTRTCFARKTARIAEYPGRKPKKTLPVKTTWMLVIENTKREVLLEKRPPIGVWGGLWSFPEAQSPTADDYLITRGIATKVIQKQSLAPFRHTFTHFHLDITPVHVQVESPNAIGEDQSVCWYSAEYPLQIGLAGPVARIIGALGAATVLD